MKKHLFGVALLMCLMVIGVNAGAQETPTIDEIQNYELDGTPNSPYAGLSVQVTGVVYVVKGTYNSGTHYIQGPTGGISFFSSGLNVNIGDEVEVTGTVGEYQGEIQLSNPSAPGPHTFVGEPTPISLTPSEVLYDYETVGNFADVIGEVKSKQSNRFYLVAGDDSLQVYIDSDTNIDISGVEVGATVLVRGPVVKYQAEIELKPRMQADIVLDATLPVIQNVNCVNWVPMEDDPIQVTAVITDDVGVSSAMVYYRDSDGDVAGSWASVPMSNTGGDNFMGTVPGGHYDGQVDFYVEATDQEAQTVALPASAPDAFYSVAVGLTTIYELQTVPLHPDSSQTTPYLDRFLNIKGVVTAGTGQVGDDQTRFIVQEQEMNPETDSYAFGGVLVYESTGTFQYFRGDLVEVGGVGGEFNGITEILPHNAYAVNFLDYGADLPEPSRRANHVLADYETNGGEPWESVWMKTFASAVYDTLGYGEYIICDKDSRADSLLVDPVIDLTYQPIIGDVITVESFLFYEFGRYRIKPFADEWVILTGLTAADDTPTVLPAGGFTSVHPNPFNPVTNVKFVINRDNLVQLNIYNIRGELVRNLLQDRLPANEYTLVWDGTNDAGQNVASGAYFARLRIGAEVTQVRKMSLVK